MIDKNEQQVILAVTLELIEAYHITETEAEKWIDESGFKNTLSRDLEYVEHKNASYWAKMIYENAQSNFH